LNGNRRILNNMRKIRHVLLQHGYMKHIVDSIQRRWQSNNKVHGDLIPFPYGNIHLLQQTRRPLMLCLHPLTNEASGNKLSNISLHTCPPEELPQIPKHLGSTWMDSVP